jgi:membrane-bound ClpP family serine protease
MAQAMPRAIGPRPVVDFPSRRPPRWRWIAPGAVFLLFLVLGFLYVIEVMLLSLVGGVIGILLGVGGSFALAKLAGWSMAATWPAIALSFGIAAFVGVFFAYYAARWRRGSTRPRRCVTTDEERGHARRGAVEVRAGTHDPSMQQ